MRLCGLVLVVCVGSAQLEPIFSREEDGGISVTIQDFDGLEAVTLTVSGERDKHVVHPTQTADSQWRASIPDVTGTDGTLNYVVEYKLQNVVQKRKGSIQLTGQQTAMLPPSRRHLQKRATTVFFDDFSSGHIDPAKWSHTIAATGFGNNEFQMYTSDPVNSYVKNGLLYIRPTLTVDKFGADFLNTGHLDMKAQWGRCDGGCNLRGNQIPPVMSAKLSSKGHIRYGKVEVVAKLPKGDWLWPAIWMMPTEDQYGGWPRSGEIDIMESRGNLRYHSSQGWTVGANQDNVNIHYGEAWNNKRSHGGQYTLRGTTFADGFHTFWMDWTESHITLGVDSHTILAKNTPASGYWAAGRFKGSNPWAGGGRDAPFDRPFYVILNVAVGGNYFSSSLKNEPYPQPWRDNSPAVNKLVEFWAARHLWEPTWHGEDVAMQVRSVKLVQY